MDVLVISSGFVLRAVAGAVVIDVEMSSWLLICTIFLALFIALGKRIHEVASLHPDKVQELKTAYNPHFLDQSISVVTASTILTYSLYTMAEETVTRFQTTNLKYTIPLALYGIFRYLYLIYHKNLGGSPEEILLTDKPLLISIGLWILSVIIIIYL